MERTEWTLGADDAGRRLERILRCVLQENSKGAVESVLRKGLVKLNGKKARSSAVTQAGDRLSAASFLLRPELLQKSGENQNASPASSAGSESGADKEAAIPWPVVFKNEHLIVLDKPEGVPVHGSGSVAEYFSRQKNSSLAFVPAPLHRLDKETSGLLAVSQSLLGAVWFSKAVREREVKKFYMGIVLGILKTEELWEDTLFLEEKKDGVFAKTIASPVRTGLVRGAPATLVRFHIFTGRKRQIRAQSAVHGHPLLGDKKFGQKEGRFFLRAVRMEFPPNDLGVPAAIDAPDCPWQRLF